MDLESTSSSEGLVTDGAGETPFVLVNRLDVVLQSLVEMKGLLANFALEVSDVVVDSPDVGRHIGLPSKG